MRHFGEAVPTSEPIERPIDVGFESTGDRDVLDAPARRADEVMMMLGEVLCQLVAAELVVGDDAPDDAGVLEGGEVPVHRALREPRRGQQLGNARSWALTRKRVDEGPPL
jgi:hypothetical protein